MSEGPNKNCEEKKKKRWNIQHVASVGQRIKSEFPTGIEPMTFRTLVGRSNHRATGRLVASKGHIYWVRGEFYENYENYENCKNSQTTKKGSNMSEDPTRTVNLQKLREFR